MTIEERFGRLEKEYQEFKEKVEKRSGRQKRLSLASIALALAALIGGTALSVRAYMAAIEPGFITTRQITLKDSSGRVRLVLDGEQGRVRAFDLNGKMRARLSPGGVTTHNANNTGSTFLSADGYIAVADANGKERSQLTGPGELFLRDANGKVRAYISSAGWVNVYDGNEKKRVELTSAGSNSAIYVRDGNGIGRVLVYGDGKIYFRNESGQNVASHP